MKRARINNKEVLKDFSSVPGTDTGDKDQIYFVLYHNYSEMMRKSHLKEILKELPGLGSSGTLEEEF